MIGGRALPYRLAEAIVTRSKSGFAGVTKKRLRIKRNY